MGELYIVATPIGNLKDITLRALEVLKDSDLILAEDTRVTKKILERYSINKALESYHQHTSAEKTNYILGLLAEGKKIALVTDSGTPGISDPGEALVKEVSKEMEGIKIIPVPGPSAIAAAASISGFPMERFLFLGFPPSKKKRRKFFEEMAESKYPVIIYESPHRIMKTLENMEEISNDFYLVVCRELTKKFETVVRGRISDVESVLRQTKPMGEYVVVVRNEKN